MINILVPTDFSPLSKVAVQYAIKIANKLDGEITLIHVIDFSKTFMATLTMKMNSKEYVQEIKQKLQALGEEITRVSRAKRPLKYKIAKGASFNETILKESKKLRSGLIIMGTKGASGIKKAILGSNTASILGASHIPVLAVPERANFKPFRNVIYATDLNHLEEELSVLIPYVEKFGSTIHILHIIEEGKNVDAIEGQIQQAVDKTGYKNIVTLVTVDQDIDAAIEQYITVCKADLVAMFTREPTFYEKLLDKSITRKMAFESKTPLLAFRQK